MSQGRGEFFTPSYQGIREIPVDALLQSLQDGKTEPVEITVMGHGLKIGRPPVEIREAGKTGIIIPNEPYAFVVNSLTLQCPIEGQDITLRNAMVLHCHGSRNSREWYAANGANIIDIVWGYNGWVRESNNGLPPIAAIISCGRGLYETSISYIGLNGDVRYRRTVAEDTNLPLRYGWIPQVIFPKSGLMYIDSSRVDASGVSMSVHSDRALVTVNEYRKPVRI